jgi:hypothetical protein
MMNKPERQGDIATRARDSYVSGSPVVIRATDGGVLHGEETLRTIADTGASLNVFVISDVDRREFEESDLPEFCEALRTVWLKDGFGKMK